MYLKAWFLAILLVVISLVGCNSQARRNVSVSNQKEKYKNHFLTNDLILNFLKFSIGKSSSIIAIRACI